MQFPCELKKLGGSHYIIVNTYILNKFQLKEGDILITEFIGKEKEDKKKRGN